MINPAKCLIMFGETPSIVTNKISELCYNYLILVLIGSTTYGEVSEFGREDLEEDYAMGREFFVDGR